MEEGNQQQQQTESMHSTSLASELFGSRESNQPTGVFGSIFAPPPRRDQVHGKECLRLESEKKQSLESEACIMKSGTQDAPRGSVESQDTLKRDTSSIYHEQRAQPCHLSSSIYYGGQENYCHTPSTQGSGLNTMFNKDAGEDDSGIASRGNWWKGSLYY